MHTSAVASCVEPLLHFAAYAILFNPVFSFLPLSPTPPFSALTLAREECSVCSPPNLLKVSNEYRLPILNQGIREAPAEQAQAGVEAGRMALATVDVVLMVVLMAAYRWRQSQPSELKRQGGHFSSLT